MRQSLTRRLLTRKA